MSWKTFLNKLLCRPCVFCEIVQGNTLDRVIFQVKHRADAHFAYCFILPLVLLFVVSGDPVFS